MTEQTATIRSGRKHARWWLGLAVVAAVLVLLGVGHGNRQAKVDDHYVQALHARGVSASLTTAVASPELKTGRVVCDALRSGVSVTEVDTVLATSAKVTATEAHNVVLATVETYCPDVPLS